MNFTLRQETLSSKSGSYADQSMFLILITYNQTGALRITESELMDEVLQRQVYMLQSISHVDILNKWINTSHFRVEHKTQSSGTTN